MLINGAYLSLSDAQHMLRPVVRQGMGKINFRQVMIVNVVKQAE